MTLSNQLTKDTGSSAPRLAADLVVDTLVAWGIRHVLTCPGSTEAAFLHAASMCEYLEVVLTTHESIAVSMADGLARLTGRPAVAYLHANVGLTNGLSHLYAAQLANSPVVVLTGLNQLQLQSRGGFTTATTPRDFVRQYSSGTGSRCGLTMSPTTSRARSRSLPQVPRDRLGSAYRRT